jgi:hypothetical protein
VPASPPYYRRDLIVPQAGSGARRNLHVQASARRTDHLGDSSNTSSFHAARWTEPKEAHSTRRPHALSSQGPVSVWRHRWTTSISEALSGPVASRLRESAGPSPCPERLSVARTELCGTNSEPLLSAMPDLIIRRRSISVSYRGDPWLLRTPLTPHGPRCFRRPLWILRATWSTATSVPKGALARNFGISREPFTPTTVRRRPGEYPATRRAGN